MKIKKFIPVLCIPAVVAPLTACTSAKDEPFTKTYDLSKTEWTPELQLSEREFSVRHAIWTYLTITDHNKEILADDIAYSRIHHIDPTTGNYEVTINDVTGKDNTISVKLTTYSSPSSEPTWFELNNIEMYCYYGPYIFDQSLEPTVFGWQIVPWALFTALQGAGYEAAYRYLKWNEHWSIDTKLPGVADIEHLDHNSDLTDFEEALTAAIGFGTLAFQSYYFDKLLPR